jgi:hypothetical protein
MVDISSARETISLKVPGGRQHGHRLLNMAGVDALPLRRSNGRRQDRHAAAVVEQTGLHRLPVDLFVGHRQVGDAAVGGNVHQNGHITKARVQVHQHHRLPRLLHQRGSDVCGDGGLADASLGPEDGQHGAEALRLHLSCQPLLPPLVLRQHGEDRPADVLLLERHHQVVLNADLHRLPDCARVADGGIGDDRHRRKDIGHRLDGLERASDGLLQGGYDYLRVGLLGQGDGLHPKAGRPHYGEAGQGQHPLRLRPAGGVLVDDDDLRISGHDDPYLTVLVVSRY